jgi:hypothetical protein
VAIDREDIDCSVAAHESTDGSMMGIDWRRVMDVILVGHDEEDTQGARRYSKDPTSSDLDL